MRISNYFIVAEDVFNVINVNNAIAAAIIAVVIGGVIFLTRHISLKK